MSMHKGLIGKSEGGASVKHLDRGEEVTLGDYIHRKTRQEAFDAVANEKKLSFDEWYQRRLIEFDGEHPSAAVVWKAAQENV